MPDERMGNLLELNGLTRAFGGLVAVNQVSFSLGEKEILGLIGPNGAGKTTVYNLISGLLSLDKGRIILRGEDITDYPVHERVKKGIARTFQGVRIFRNLSLVLNLKIARHCRLKDQGAGGKDAQGEVVVGTMEFLGLGNLKDKLAGDLRLIDQALLGIGMALCTEAKVLLLDEPSGGLNLNEVSMVMSVVEKIRKSGTPILLIEHNMKAVMSVCDRIVVLNHGEKIAEGTPTEISNHKEVIKAYLGTKYAART